MTLPSQSQETDQSPDVSRAAAAQKFAALSDKFMKESLALSPSSASAAGYHVHHDPKTGKTIEMDALLDDLSLESIAQQGAFYANWRERFREETPLTDLDPEDAADWQLVDDQIGLSLLEFGKIQSYRHNPTVVVELIGNALFLPLTQTYAPHDVRVGHVLSRVQQIPRLLKQVKPYLTDADPVWVSTAVEENSGNIDLIENTLAQEIPVGSPLKAQYDEAAPPAIAALNDFSRLVAKRFGETSIEADLAFRQRTLRSEIQAGDGNAGDTGTSPGRRGPGHEIGARRNAADRASAARANVSGAQ